MADRAPARRKADVSSEQTRVEHGRRTAAPSNTGGLLLRLQRTAGNHAVQRLVRSVQSGIVQREIQSPRFRGNADLAAVDAGTLVLTAENAGAAPRVSVRIIQQALRDLGQELPVTGLFDRATIAVVQNVNKDGTAAFGRAAMARLDSAFNVRALDARLAKKNPLNDARAIEPGEREEVLGALVPPVRTDQSGKKLPFDPRNTQTYQAQLDSTLWTVVEPLAGSIGDRGTTRFDTETVATWDSIEKIAVEAKAATDIIFGDYKTMPAMVRGKNLSDRWDATTDEFKGMDRSKLLILAEDIAGKYMRNSPRVSALNQQFNVDPSNPEHRTTLLQPVLAAFANKHLVELLEMHRNQPGSADPRSGKVKIQRFKSTNANADHWQSFATLVHEYIHTIAHANYYDWVYSLDAERKFTLTEGITDAFTRVVLANLSGEAAELKKAQAPGAYRGTYADAADRAEQMIAQVGVRNAYGAYFFGRVEYIGGPKKPA